MADHFDEVHMIPESGCWIWAGTEFASGYGRIGNERAHRVFYERENGKIPDGLFACHKCDTPLCCNPDHIFLGTTEENMADMVAKGRSAKGERHGRAKITQEQAEQIRQSPLNCRDAAAAFGISKSMVSLIRRRENWV